MVKTMEEATKTLEFAARFAAQKGMARFTRFLDPAQAQEAALLARAQGVCFDCWGGYEQAERVMACFLPAGESVEREEYPLVCLRSRFLAKFCTVTHRDLLGAFMALGLTRACIGDIIISGAEIFLFSTAQTADFVAQSLTSAGKATLSFQRMEGIPDIPLPSGRTFSAIVSSLRLDAVLASAYRLSRNESAELIRAGLVKVDHLPCERVDASLHEGSLLSVRGKGRVRLVSVDGMTRKQRIGITFFRYE